MSATTHTLSLVFAIILAFIWLHIPLLNQYSLQAFAASMVAYLIIKKLHKTSLSQLGPGSMSSELSILTFAVLVLIGFTGDTRSLLYALNYVYLFLLVFAAETSTAIIITTGIVLYYYALTIDPTLQNYANLVTLPLMMVFFIFAKAQYQDATRRRQQVELEETALASSHYTSTQLKSFLNEFLKPKLEYLTTLLIQPNQNKQALQGQLALLQVEIEKIIVRCDDDQESIETKIEVALSDEQNPETKSDQQTIKTTETSS